MNASVALQASSAVSSAPTDEARIDFSRFFLPEELTPLYHTSEYKDLSAAVRRRYNQLHAFYFNEQVAFFEQEMLSPALLAVRRAPGLPDELRWASLKFFEEEQHHTEMFRSLNLAAAPEFYRQDAYYFIRLPRFCRAALRALSGLPRALPMLMWLALLQEERSLFYSKCCLENGSGLEPRFVALHRAHLADEVGHVGWDERLLDWLWPRAGRTTRKMTAKILGWMIGEFFHLPKRSGRNVVHQLAREFSEVNGPALDAAMRRLENNPAFLETIYSRRIAPRSFRRFESHSEFALLARTLAVYPAASDPATA